MSMQPPKKDAYSGEIVYLGQYDEEYEWGDNDEGVRVSSYDGRPPGPREREMWREYLRSEGRNGPPSQARTFGRRAE